MVWTSMLAHAFNASKEQITTLGITMGYRKCVITNENSKEALILVVYLHGGSSKGNDNEKQLLEPGTDSIARYLETHGINAIFLIPQCPTDKSWGGPMNTMLKAMIDRYASEGVADTNRIYIFGGSMGGTGTWGMLSAYPNFFAAAMPVAANPSKTVVENVATRPAYTVMGTADAIMKVETAASFVEELKALDDDVRMDVEEVGLTKQPAYRVTPPPVSNGCLATGAAPRRPSCGPQASAKWCPPSSSLSTASVSATPSPANSLSEGIYWPTAPQKSPRPWRQPHISLVHTL